ncbi:MAG: hypothetical protein CSA97_04980 [Bacteroidetes bacterium]|nr:MAG: hypothetical protein CSA97_04980 [Bacteroidota bacterium]
MMKRLLYLPLLVGLLFSSCGGQPSGGNGDSNASDSPVEAVETGVAGDDGLVDIPVNQRPDVAYIVEGELFLLNAVTLEKQPVEAEKEAVFSCVFSPDDGMLYYTVVRGAKLAALKRAKFEDGKCTGLEELCSLDIPLEECISIDQMAAPFFSEGVVIIPYEPYTDDLGFMSCAVYNPESGVATQKAELNELELKDDSLSPSCHIVPEEGEDGEEACSGLSVSKDKDLLYKGKVIARASDFADAPDRYMEARPSKDGKLVVCGSGYYDPYGGPMLVAKTDGSGCYIFKHARTGFDPYPRFLGDSHSLILNNGGLKIYSCRDFSERVVEENVDFWCAR